MGSPVFCEIKRYGFFTLIINLSGMLPNETSKGFVKLTKTPKSSDVHSVISTSYFISPGLISLLTIKFTFKTSRITLIYESAIRFLPSNLFWEVMKLGTMIGCAKWTEIFPFLCNLGISGFLTFSSLDPDYVKKPLLNPNLPLFLSLSF